MKILITGGAGFIGSHTADRLLEMGHEVRVLDCLTQPVHPESKRPAYLDPRIEFMEGDVTNKGHLFKALEDIGVKYDGLIRTGNNNIILVYSGYEIDTGIKVNYEQLPLKEINLLDSISAIN